LFSGQVGRKPTFFLGRGSTVGKPNTKEALEQLRVESEKLVAPLGYEIVALEQSTAPGIGRTLTLFIDFASEIPGHRISLDDCTAVNNAVDELFETTPLLEGRYTLEVSSPGVERPLRRAEDYSRFRGRRARLHTFRPLESAESENPAYWEKNRKQKNFVGLLEGLTPDGLKVRMNIDGAQVAVPLELISKAHLEFMPQEDIKEMRNLT